MNVHRILVLDDDIGVCTVLTRILADQQYDVQTSQSVGNAAETLAETSFDAYLLDYWLQDGTGLQVAEKVREQGSTAPIILISGYGATDIAAKATTLNIFDVLQKPFTRETICKTLDRALGRSSPAPIPLPEEILASATVRFRLRTWHVGLITAALLFVAVWLFLMLR